MPANARHGDEALLRKVLLRFGVENVVEPFKRDIDLLKVSPQIDEAEDRTRDADDQDIERNELTYRKLSIDDEPGAVPKEKNNIQRLQDIADRDDGHPRHGVAKLHVEG